MQNKHGHALVRDAEKIYLDNPNLLYALNEEIGYEPSLGVMRELFVISSLQNAHYHVFYHPKADIECEGLVFEIGGKSKSTAKIRDNKQDFLVKDDILIGTAKIIPLYLFGFLS